MSVACIGIPNSVDVGIRPSLLFVRKRTAYLIKFADWARPYALGIYTIALSSLVLGPSIS